MKKIKKECEEYGSPLPEVEIKNSGVMVKCVPSKIYMELLDKMEGRNVPVNLNKTENEILNLIIKNNNITHIEIANALKITDKTAKRNTEKY